MAIDFPASPSNGQTFVVGSVTYTYDGTKWTAVAAGGGAVDKIEEGNTTAEVIDTGADGRFVVTTEGTERLRIDSSGRLLVGTSSSRSVFGLQGELQIEGTGYKSLSIISNDNSSAGVGPFLQLARSRGTSIGSNTVVQNDDLLGTIAFCGTDGSDLTSAGARINAFVDGTPGADDLPTRLVFSTTADGASSPTERLRIDSAGRVGIGTASPSSTLHLSAAQAELKIQSTSGTNPGYLSFIPGGVSNPYYIYADSNRNFIFEDFATERMRITSDAYVRLASGTGGIQFNGDTAAANALDDYEEGTWTPVFNATGATFSTISNVARYTKIGNTVKLSGYCQIYCSAGGGANVVTVTGLPFATPNIFTMYQGGMLGSPSSFTATGYGLTGLIIPNSTTVVLNKFTDVGGSKRTEALNSADITNANFSFLWTLMYQAA